MRVGVVLAVSGSAVGLGNFLHVHDQAAAHGGGGFMIPYVCALLFLACRSTRRNVRLSERLGSHAAAAPLA
jgi:SNF family Na+-dependent transporter